jgi:hypothetical protein
MLISSGNALIDTHRNNVFQTVWASIGPVKLPCRIIIFMSLKIMYDSKNSGD